MNSGRRYGVYPGFEGLEVSVAQRLSRTHQVLLASNWFHGHFEDPAERLPFSSRDGGYQWIYGGPNTAADQLFDEFGDIIDEDVLSEAVADIESDGLTEWAPRPEPSDYDQDEGSFVGMPDGVADGEGEWPPIIAIPVEPEELQSAADSLFAALDDIESDIAPVLANAPPIGHNNPPGAIEDQQPVTQSQVRDLSEQINSLRAGMLAEVLEPTRFVRARRVFGQLASHLTQWIGGRVTKAVDTAIVSVVGAAGVGAMLNVSKLAEHLEAAIMAIDRILEVVKVVL